MPRRILIVDDSTDLRATAELDLSTYSDLIVLCWIAPETLWRFQQADSLSCHTLLEVVGGQRRWEEQAAGLAKEVCAAGPHYRDRPWRDFLTEPLFREALTVQAVLDAVHLCRQLAGDHATLSIHLTVDTTLARFFRQVIEDDDRLGLEAGAEGPVAAHRDGLGRRLARRAHHAYLTGGWLTQMRNLAAQADRSLHLRRFAGRLLRRPHIEPGGTTCFSSYLNNSRTLQHLEPHLPGAGNAVNWVVTNYPARQGVAATAASVHDLWRFSDSSTDAAGHTEATSLPAFDESARGRALQAWLTTSPTWRYWQDFGYQSLTVLTACWESYLTLARPRLLVVASHWGIEGWLSQIAHDRGIAVVEAQHGLLAGTFYTEHALAADALVVWGDYWRNQRPAEIRPKVHAFNPGVFSGTRESRRADSSRPTSALPRVTFFSWPFDRLAFYNRRELLDGFIDLFGALLAERSCELTIRSHPLENPSHLTRHWQQRHGALPSRLQWSQKEPLIDVLERTEIAVMLRSTVLFDCVAHGIPVLLTGWIDFDWSHGLDDIEGIHLARDFTQLRQTLAGWLREPPVPSPEMGQSFLRPEGEGSQAFEQLLEALWRGEAGANRPGEAANPMFGLEGTGRPARAVRAEPSMQE